MDTSPLPQAGLNGVCDDGPTVKAPEEQTTSTYHGKGDAVARYRVATYANTAQATEATRALAETLHGCGLKKYSDGRYKGLTKGSNHVWLEISVKRWESWVGVLDTQYSSTP
ncbi:hypothetical protein [Streptomyces sp. NPDC055140]